MQLSLTRTDVPDSLAELRAAVRDQSGPTRAPSAVPGMTLYAETTPTPPLPVVFGPVLYFPVQGDKQLLTAERTIAYGSGDLVVCALHLPALAQVTRASTAEPYLAIELRLDELLLADMITSVAPTTGTPEAISVHRAPTAVFDPLTRLVRMVRDRRQADVLADGALREVLFHLLAGPHGPAVAALGAANGVVARIGRAIAWMSRHLDTHVDVVRLARHVEMSASSLHRNFKAVTGTTPAAFHKRLRLHEARRLGVAGDDDITRIAHRVGYVSASQFSRDYKTLFGASPGRDLANVRGSAHHQ